MHRSATALARIIIPETAGTTETHSAQRCSARELLTGMITAVASETREGVPARVLKLTYLSVPELESFATRQTSVEAWAQLTSIFDMKSPDIRGLLLIVREDLITFSRTLNAISNLQKNALMGRTAHVTVSMSDLEMANMVRAIIPAEYTADERQQARLRNARDMLTSMIAAASVRTDDLLETLFTLTRFTVAEFEQFYTRQTDPTVRKQMKGLFDERPNEIRALLLLVRIHLESFAQQLDTITQLQRDGFLPTSSPTDLVPTEGDDL